LLMLMLCLFSYIWYINLLISGAKVKGRNYFTKKALRSYK
jgi:hypothetical protein